MCSISLPFMLFDCLQTKICALRSIYWMKKGTATICDSSPSLQTENCRKDVIIDHECQRGIHTDRNSKKKKERKTKRLSFPLAKRKKTRSELSSFGEFLNFVIFVSAWSMQPGPSGSCGGVDLKRSPLEHTWLWKRFSTTRCCKERAFSHC